MRLALKNVAAKRSCAIGEYGGGQMNLPSSLSEKSIPVQKHLALAWFSANYGHETALWPGDRPHVGMPISSPTGC